MFRKLSFDEAKAQVFFAKHKRVFAVNDSGTQAIIVYNPTNDTIMASDGSDQYKDGWEVNNTADFFSDLFSPDVFHHHVLIYTDLNGVEREYLNPSEYICIQHLADQRWTKENREQRIRRRTQEYHRRQPEEVIQLMQQVDAGVFDKSKVMELLEDLQKKSG